MREMKDSGVEWIGFIPQKWELIKLKNICVGFSNGSSATQLSNGISDYPVSRIETISKGEINLDKTGYVESISVKYLLRENDFLVSNINSIQYLGNCAMVKKEKLYHGMNLIRIIPDGIEPLFLYFFLKSFCFITPMQMFCKPAINQASVSSSSMKQFPCPFPTINEQRIIASFLDAKCAEIDALSADIQKEIETLQEYRKSVITEAVTKGLDPNVEMKDSGIEWIGEIPVHWNLVPFYRLVDQVSDSIVDGPFGSDMKNEEYVDEGVPVIQLGAIKENGMDFSKMHFITDSKADILRRHNAFPFNLAIAKMMPAGRCCEIPDKFERYVVSADVIRASVSNTVLRHFLNYAFNTYIKVWANAETSGSTRARINIEKLKKFKFALPDQNEMEFILNKLDSECTEIDSIIADKQKQLETLAEYRKSLIYEYVTGKKEVPTA